VNKLVEKKEKTRDIGLNIKAPEEVCEDKYCPFHGTLSVRGQVITGIVDSMKMQNSILVKKEFMHYVPKYERYEKRSSKFTAHCPPCLKVNVGDKVRIAECRPLSKTVSFVAVEKL
jgi:small subunit ribosomal protein S17